MGNLNAARIAAYRDERLNRLLKYSHVQVHAEPLRNVNC